MTYIDYFFYSYIIHTLMPCAIFIGYGFLLRNNVLLLQHYFMRRVYMYMIYVIVMLCYKRFFRIFYGVHYYSTMTVNIYDACAQKLRKTWGRYGKERSQNSQVMRYKSCHCRKPSSWNSNTSGSNQRVGNIEQIVTDKDANLTVYAKRR